MNTKSIPIIITLSAAGISCVISILEGVDFPTFLVRLLLTVLFFYIIGIIVGIILFNAFSSSSNGNGKNEKAIDNIEKENFETKETNTHAETTDNNEAVSDKKPDGNTDTVEEGADFEKDTELGATSEDELPREDATDAAVEEVESNMAAEMEDEHLQDAVDTTGSMNEDISQETTQEQDEDAIDESE